ncbi:hypothetical protein Vadar_020178 [Vaccinium darrowii]|uniref:Uncharacterized protein n=1 Tax=Vaccinium darrowii TaxID=229202 RepID=A0ACB7X2Y2_9ERIC|nr:hypothetical protein Vadar_020178 [Vaccinium darrowii]
MLKHLQQFHNNKLKPTKSQDYIHPYLDRRDFYAHFKVNSTSSMPATLTRLDTLLLIKAIVITKRNSGETSAQ